MTPAIAIFDIGKTNKKLLLFDSMYKILFEEQVQFPEILDEDGFHTEDLQKLRNWIVSSFEAICTDTRFSITALNFSSYGASFVHLNADKEVLTPLYNYLKPFPENLKNTFEKRVAFTVQTASPILGMLNSGLQLYWLKYQKPQLFSQITHALHLPDRKSVV